MYRRIKTTATAFRNVGASHVDDAWIKRKYVSALMPFEPTDLKSLQGRHNYHLMTSNEVMQEMSAFKVAAKNAKDARARALGMSNVVNVALKAKVVDHGDEDDSDEGLSMDHPDEVKIAHSQYMAFYAKNFWKNPAKAKMEMQQRSNPNGKRENTTRLRTCFNCGDRYHFVASCPYEKREDNGGKLVLKKTLKGPYKKPFIKKNPINKKPGEIVLITHEEYSSDNEDDEEETSHGVAALATTSTPTFSLFDSPNENSSTKNATCLMARGTEVSSSSRSTHLDNDEIDDEMSLDVKKELIAFDEFMTNLEGDAKLHFGNILDQLSHTQELLDVICKIGHEHMIELEALNNALEEEQETRLSLELKLEGLDEANDIIVNKLIKERDHAISKYKRAKKDKVEFGVVHEKLAEDFSLLNKAHKALESELLSLTKSHETLQTQLANIPSPSNFIPSSSTTILEENARLKGYLAKATFPQDKKSIDDLLSKQRRCGDKGGIGFISKTKKKKDKPAQETNKTIVGSKTTIGKTMSHDDF